MAQFYNKGDTNRQLDRTGKYYAGSHKDDILLVWQYDRSEDRGGV